MPARRSHRLFSKTGGRGEKDPTSPRSHGTFLRQEESPGALGSPRAPRIAGAARGGRAARLSRASSSCGPQLCRAGGPRERWDPMATPLGPRRSPPSSLTPQLCLAALGAVRAPGRGSAEMAPKPAPRHDAAAAPAPLSRLTVGLAAGGSRESPWPCANRANPELASESSAGSAAGCGGQCRRGTRRGGLRSPGLSACRADGDASA